MADLDAKAPAVVGRGLLDTGRSDFLCWHNSTSGWAIQQCPLHHHRIGEIPRPLCSVMSSQGAHKLQLRGT